MKLDFDAISPISGKKSVFENYDSVTGTILALCMESGYHTIKPLWKYGTDAVNSIESHIPKEYSNVKFIDDENYVWYPYMVINSKAMAILKPNIEGKNIEWAVAELTTTDDGSAPIVIRSPMQVDTKSIFYEKPDSVKVFSKECFGEALDHYYKIVYSKEETR